MVQYIFGFLKSKWYYQLYFPEPGRFFFLVEEQNNVKFYSDTLPHDVFISKNKLEINIIMIILKRAGVIC